MSHYTEGRKWSDLYNAWIFDDSNINYEPQALAIAKQLKNEWPEDCDLDKASNILIEQHEMLKNLRRGFEVLLEERDSLREIILELLQALIHLEHNARKSGAEMGLALEIAQKAIEKGKECGL